MTLRQVVVFCPMHAAAEEMLAALEKAAEVLRDEGARNIAAELETMIAAARGGAA